ncbi:dermonecrotic toxin domain-containing protein [Pseudomonas parafulva]|uniref:dermonecrotic toxin domain-containing protein n=1 Tax=Pseudomonas parafulva TaxID=157782 RepID=UPI0013C318B3|nr:DUF6543 domain-containing protein [Pseudomonas parafulva]
MNSTAATPPSTSCATPPASQQQLIACHTPAWMVAAPADVHSRLRAAQRAVPAWFQDCRLARPDAARALASAYAVSRAADAAVGKRLEALPDLLPFARALLAPALKDRFGLALDVDRTYLFNANKAVAYQQEVNGDPIQGAARAFKLATQSLLHCALQNFEADEACEGGLDAAGLSALVLDSDRFESVIPSGQVIDIAPHAFAALCRELDIGGNYLKQVEGLCNDGSSTALFTQAQRGQWHLEVHRAYLSGMLEHGLFEALLTLADSGQAQYLDSPLRCARMRLLGFELTGAVVIGLVPSPERLLVYDPLLLPYKGLLLTYLPGAPSPLQVHANSQQAQHYLREQLSIMDLGALSRAVAAADSAAFLTRLRDVLQPIDWTTVTPEPGHGGASAQRRPDPNAWITLTLAPFTQAFLDERVSQWQQRLRQDALFHAVPSAEEDRKSAARRRAYFSQWASDALMVAAFVVPGLDQLMLSLSIAQLSYETYEGFDSWADGEREQAQGYLMDVVENLALTAALGAAGAAAGAQAAVPRSAFIEALHPVELPNGEQRLWKPDLQPFAHDITLPTSLQPDALGLLHHQDRTWLTLEGQTYAVGHSPQTDQYHLLPAHPAMSYRLPLRHNRAGIWLHALDRPSAWQGLKLFRRLGTLGAAVGDDLALRFAQFSGVEDSVLRRALSHSERLPALLEDALLRLKLEQAIAQDSAGLPLAQRRSEFQRRYRQLPCTEAPGAAVIQRVYPNLPNAVTEELLGNATADEVQQLIDGKVPLRVGEEIRVYQQQLRLNRAYEGLYLDAAHSADSDRLILHTAAQLPDWPAGLAIDLHEGAIDPQPIDRVGPGDSLQRKLITRYPNGYTVSKPYPDSPTLRLHATLHDALHEALGSGTAVDATALREQIRHAPAMSRDALRRHLGLQRRTLRSPMRLADGRFGYPLSPTPRPLLHDIGNLDAINRHLRQLEGQGFSPAIANWILSNLADAPITHEAMTQRIAQLPSASAVELDNSLAAWRASPGQISDAITRIHARNSIEMAIWGHWIERAIPESSPSPDTLTLERTFIAEFPQQLPESFTSGVKRLRLSDVWIAHALEQEAPQALIEGHLHNLFQHFPALEALEIERPYASDAPPSAFRYSLGPISERLAGLRELRLVNQNIELSVQAIDRLASPETMTYLDLGGNALIPQADAQLSPWRLQYLGLERMALTHWPAWLNLDALERIEAVSLLHNDLHQVPAFLTLNEQSDTFHTIVSLSGNPLSEAHLRNLMFSEDGLARRFHFNLAAPLHLLPELQTLFNQRSQLREALFNWVSSAPAPGGATQLRWQIANDLSGYWEARVRGAQTPLHLIDLALEHFPPVLPSAFDQQVDHLILERLNGTPAQLDTLLRRFPRLSTLALYENIQSLQHVPTAITELASLVELELVNQGLTIDNDDLQALLRLPALKALDLSDNVLSPALSGPFQVARRLESLSLSKTGMTAWADWLFDVMPRQILDLDDNQISRLPDSVLGVSTVDTGRTRVSLMGNPLEADIVQRLDDPESLHLYLPHDYPP